MRAARKARDFNALSLCLGVQSEIEASEEYNDPSSRSGRKHESQVAAKKPRESQVNPVVEILPTGGVFEVDNSII